MGQVKDHVACCLRGTGDGLTGLRFLQVGTTLGHFAEVSVFSRNSLRGFGLQLPNRNFGRHADLATDAEARGPTRLGIWVQGSRKNCRSVFKKYTRIGSWSMRIVVRRQNESKFSLHNRL